MGRMLTVYYWINKDLYEQYCHSSGNIEDCEKLGECFAYSRNDQCNVDLGFREFTGSPQELANHIQSLVNQVCNYEDYIIIGNLSLILAECPDDSYFIDLFN